MNAKEWFILFSIRNLPTVMIKVKEKLQKMFNADLKLTKNI